MTGIVLALLAAVFAMAGPAVAGDLEFTGQGDLTSDTGYVMLNWHSGKPVSLMIATMPDFSDAVTVYDGEAHSFFLSGLDDGHFFLRLREDGGAVSAPVELSVTHQSLARALWLLTIGALITLAIVVTILRGARDE